MRINYCTPVIVWLCLFIIYWSSSDIDKRKKGTNNHRKEDNGVRRGYKTSSKSIEIVRWYSWFKKFLCKPCSSDTVRYFLSWTLDITLNLRLINSGILSEHISNKKSFIAEDRCIFHPTQQIRLLNFILFFIFKDTLTQWTYQRGL